MNKLELADEFEKLAKEADATNDYRETPVTFALRHRAKKLRVEATEVVPEVKGNAADDSLVKCWPKVPEAAKEHIRELNGRVNELKAVLFRHTTTWTGQGFICPECGDEKRDRVETMDKVICTPRCEYAFARAVLKRQ